MARPKSTSASWEEVAKRSVRNEADVETRILLPLLALLGWSSSEIHSKVPIPGRIGSGRKGRKHEADFVLAPADPSAPVWAWMVIEAKAPKVGLGTAAPQARLYTMAFRAPIYLTCDGRRLQIWRLGWFEECRLEREFDVAALDSAKGELLALLNPSALKAYHERNKLTEHSIEKVDVSGYVDRVRKAQALEHLIDRDVENATRAKVVFGATRDTPVFAAGQTLWIEGRGGRGKSCLVRMLQARELMKAPADPTFRVPFTIAAKSVASSVAAGLAVALECEVPALATADAVNAWLRAVPALVMIEDWDWAPREAQEVIERFVAELPATKTTCVITSRAGSRRPSGLGEAFSVGAFTQDEQESFVSVVLGGGERARIVAHLLEFEAPFDILELLREPVICRQYLRLIVHREGGGIQLPVNLPSLLDDVVQSHLESRHARIRVHATIINSVCASLSGFDAITVARMNEALRAIGARIDAPDIVSELIEIGIVLEDHGGRYIFSHELWREHFRAKKFFEEKRNAAEVIAWVDEAGAEGAFAVPFAAALVRDRPIQSALLTALLERDPELFLRAIQARSSVRGRASTAEMLEDMLDCHEQLARVWFPGFKVAMWPWSGSGDDTDGAGILGFGDQTSLSYAYVLRRPNEPRVMLQSGATFAQETRTRRVSQRGINLERSQIRTDSSRLVAARDAVRELEGIIKYQLTLTEWTAREAILRIIRDDDLNEDLGSMTVAGACEWARQTEHGELDACSAALVEFGCGGLPISEIGVAGPDQPFQGWVGTGYSPERRRERLECVLGAALQTYREICERDFAGVKSLFFYSDFPCRPRVRLYKHPSHRRFEHQTYWEPVETWAEVKPVIEMVDDSFREIEEIEAYVSMRARALGRTFYSSVNEGLLRIWNPSDPVVTNYVREWLLDDLQNVRRRLGKSD